MGQRMNPAVAAGLIGSATFVMPETAQALSLTELVDATFARPRPRLRPEPREARR